MYLPQSQAYNQSAIFFHLPLDFLWKSKKETFSTCYLLLYAIRNELRYQMNNARETFTPPFHPSSTLLVVYWTSHTKYVSKLHGESFHFRPLPSRFHNSRQFSSSLFSYRKLLGSPAFQLVNVIGRPVAIQKKLPSSARSVPDVQKCSLPKPAKRRRVLIVGLRLLIQLKEFI